MTSADSPHIDNAIARAGAEIAGVAGVDGGAYVFHPDVRRAVGAAIELSNGPAGGAAPDLLTRTTVHYVAVAAISRAATNEKPLTDQDIDGVRKFFETIFNGLFDR